MEKETQQTNIRAIKTFRVRNKLISLCYVNKEPFWLISVNGHGHEAPATGSALISQHS